MNQADEDRVEKHQLKLIPTLKIPEIEVNYDQVENEKIQADSNVEGQTNTNKKSTNPKSLKKIMLITVLVIICLGISTILFFKLNKDDVEKVSYALPQFESLEYSEIGRNGEYQGVLYSSDGQLKVIEPCIVETFNVLNSMLLTQIETDPDNYYILTQEGYRKAIPSNCLNYIISGNGRYIYYLKYISYQNIELYCYDYKEDKTKTLAQENWISDVVLSPDGESYTVSIKDSDGMERTYLWADHKKKLLGENINVLAISDHGSYIYYVNDKKEMLCKSGNRITKLAVMPENMHDSQERFFFNYSHTEVIYTNSKSGSYFVKDGKEAIKICDDMVMEYVPSTYNNKISCYDRLSVINKLAIKIYPVEDFINHIFRTERGYIQIKENEEGRFICGTSSILTVSDDYSRIMLHNTSNDTITVQDINSSDRNARTIEVPNRIMDMLWLDDMIYCLMSDQSVNCYSLITDEVSYNVLNGVSDWIVDTEYHCFYYTNANKEVFCVNDKAYIQKIKDLDVSCLSEFCGNYYAITEDEEHEKVYLLQGTQAKRLADF